MFQPIFCIKQVYFYQVENKLIEKIEELGQAIQILFAFTENSFVKWGQLY